RYTYTKRGQVKIETRGPGDINTVDQDYYDDGLLKHLIQKGGVSSQTVAEHSLTYDANGNEKTDHALLMLADNHDNLVPRSLVYTYDPRDRVREAVDAFVQEDYLYDANNNVLIAALQDHTFAGQEYMFSDYDRNRLVQSTDEKQDPNSGSSRTVSTYSYDTI